MKSAGSQELTRVAAAYFTSIAFGVTFLIAVACGVDGSTSLYRGVVAGLFALLAAQFLAPPVANCILDAFARDEARRKAALEKEDDDK